MRIETLGIAEVKLLHLRQFGDERGFLSETYNRRRLLEAGIDLVPAQQNHSFTPRAGTLRGLHFQVPPSAQGKLVRVPHGAAFDVAVDLRRRSPSYGRHVAAVLSRAAWNQLWIPPGFAHGYLTLEPDTEVVYEIDAYYDPNCERGLDWNDPDLGISWPQVAGGPLVADRDRRWPPLANLPDGFPEAG